VRKEKGRKKGGKGVGEKKGGKKEERQV